MVAVTGHGCGALEAEVGGEFRPQFGWGKTADVLQALEMCLWMVMCAPGNRVKVVRLKPRVEVQPGALCVVVTKAS